MLQCLQDICDRARLVSYAGGRAELAGQVAGTKLIHAAQQLQRDIYRGACGIDVAEQRISKLESAKHALNRTSSVALVLSE